MRIVFVPIGLYMAHAKTWLCDDIFITLRYIKNWLNGLGITYNAEERVEGYTHFLWLCMIALGEALGFRGTEVSVALGLASYATLLILLWKFGSTIALIATAVNFEMHIWATSGLETMFFTLLVTLSVYVFFETKHWALWSGFISSLIMMTRPDGIVFVVVLFAFLVVRDPAKFSTFLIGVALYGFYFIWREGYYGFLFPNTYYAKDGGGFWYTQGLTYIWTFVATYPTFLLFVLGGFVSKMSKGYMAFWMVLAYLVLFVGRVGGDFMYARFMIPVIPLSYLAFEGWFDENSDWLLGPIRRAIPEKFRYKHL